MFTGLIEEIGIIRFLTMHGNGGVLSIKAKKVLENTKIGDSIAVNGICLTVTKLLSDGFEADVMPETIRRSSLADLTSGDQVNLERAMPADGRFGGHIVSGHIDGTGIITSLKKENNAVWVKIKASNDIMHLIAEKGSITIDGISLTVAIVSDSDFSVSIIPHTGAETTLLSKKIGDKINLETDVIAKYIDRIIYFKENTKQESGITEDFLKEMGFC